MFATQKLSGAAPLNAEAGKTYYYRVVVDDNRQQPQLWVKAMDEPEGLLMVSKSGQSNWKVKK
jgi:N-formylglutamate amidohydrolase